MCLESLAAAMHLVADEWRRTGDRKFERVLHCVRNATATRVDGGFVINGKKIFCTNSPGMTHFDLPAHGNHLTTSWRS